MRILPVAASVLAAATLAGASWPTPARAEPVGAAAEGAPPALPRARVAARLPDVELVDQDGRTVRLRSDLVGDRTVAVSFVFTTCTTICGPMSAILGRTQAEVGAALGRDVAFLSVTLDPLNDTPERLRAYGERFGRREGWSLVTGTPENVRTALKALGGWTPDRNGHAPILVVGSAAKGSWVVLDGFSSPARIAAELARVAALPDAKPRSAAR